MSKENLAASTALSGFKGLLDSLSTIESTTTALAKSLTADDGAGTGDENAAGGAAGGAGDQGAGDQGGALSGTEVDDDDDDGDEDEEIFGKSLKTELVDGKPVGIVDGAAMLTGLRRLKKSLNQETARADAAEAILKRLTPVLATVVDMQKSLASRVQAMAGQGSGRRSQVSIAAPPATRAGGPEKMDRPTIMAKSMKAMKDGKINGFQAAEIETACNSGVELPPSILSILQSV